MPLLDAMRALAALLVLLFHVDVIFGGLPLFRHTELAVDFFFMLSGFVLTASVEGKQREGHAATGFIVARIGRLWPMMALGSVIGLGTAWMRGVDSQALALSFTLALLLMPSMVVRSPIFPLNGPQWSLLLELIANVAHALVLRRLPTRMLLVLSASAWLMLSEIAGMKGEMTFGPMYPGWQLGILRIGYAYTLGCVIARLAPAIIARIRAPWWLPLALLAVLLIGPGRAPAPNGLLDMAVLLAFGPVLIIAIAADPPEGLHPAMRRAGAASWPLYALHVPLMDGANTLAVKGVLPPSLAPVAAIVLTLVAAMVLANSRIAKGFTRSKRQPSRAAPTPANSSGQPGYT